MLIGTLCGPHDYGYIAKCPFCDAINIPRAVKHQVTCGKMLCRSRQGDLRRKQLKKKKKKKSI